VHHLYQDKASSFMPADIRRDRAEVESATGFDRAAGYGEVLLDDFVDMLNGVGAQAGQHFYDLGSGLGQLVLIAGLLGLDATGVEVVNQRHQQACAVVRQAEEEGVGHDHGSINFIHDSFYNVDFSDADIVFVNSVLFSDDMMSTISEKAQTMKHGAHIISYLSLPAHDGANNHIGTWFRKAKSISMKTTFSSGTPWQKYTVVRTDCGR
jgi:SAM-dependent methyltransferase